MIKSSVQFQWGETTRQLCSPNSLEWNAMKFYPVLVYLTLRTPITHSDVFIQVPFNLKLALKSKLRQDNAPYHIFILEAEQVLGSPEKCTADTPENIKQSLHGRSFGLWKRIQHLCVNDDCDGKVSVLEVVGGEVDFQKGADGGDLNRRGGTTILELALCNLLFIILSSSQLSPMKPL